MSNGSCFILLRNTTSDFPQTKTRNGQRYLSNINFDFIQDKLPVCACIERCERAGETVVPVCGSVNGTIRTYPSECHLYKESCETGDSKITLVAHEACEKKIEEVLFFTINNPIFG